MNYLFCGSDIQVKTDRLNKIKKSFLTPNLENFNFEVFYAKEIRDKSVFEEAFLRYPVKSKARVILIKEIDKLSSAIQDFLVDYLKKPYKHLVLILETEKSFNLKDALFSRLKGLVEVEKSYPVKSLNSFDLYHAIEARRPDKALEILARILEFNKPPVILGGIAGYFKKSFARKDTKIKILLQALLEADMKLKTSSIRPEFILERLIVRLCLID